MDPEYDNLDRYLKTVFYLLEGMADVEQAFLQLRDYLEWKHENHIQPELDDFLIELFFDKCRRDFTSRTPWE